MSEPGQENPNPTSPVTESSGEQSPDQLPGQRKGWRPTLAVVVIAAVAVASAWAGFQSAKWGGQQSITHAEAAATRSLAQSAFTQAEALMGIDNQQWFAWITADSQGDTEQAQLIADRMRPEFQPAFEEWRLLYTESPAEPLTIPFELDSYEPEALVTSIGLFNESGDLSAEAVKDNDTSDNYALVTVALASVLFLAGISQNTARKPARVLVLAACGLSAVAFVALVLMPVQL
jgi:hypothetical protein